MGLYFTIGLYYTYDKIYLFHDIMICLPETSDFQSSEKNILMSFHFSTNREMDIDSFCLHNSIFSTKSLMVCYFLYLFASRIALK